MADVINKLQENYGQLMPHKILEHEDIVTKTAYHPIYPITTVFPPSKDF